MTTREEVWVRAWCAVASVPHETDEGATKWATACLAEFDKRFPQDPAQRLIGVCECGSLLVDPVDGGFDCQKCGRFIPVKISAEGAD